ncbi:MAG: hypothetical protein H7Y31_05180 [Chitinophagaceae bacterium]|nr:hypothetical protein [Chitinophagaceae bacterium]
MRQSLLIVISVLCFACNPNVKEKINTVGEKAGEVVGEAAKGVSRGIENAFEITIQKKDSVALRDISFGKILLSDSGGTDNKLSVYIIFHADMNRTMTIKVFDNAELEIGRARTTVSAKKDDATYVDFLFDPHTNMDRDHKFIIE